MQKKEPYIAVGLLLVRKGSKSSNKDSYNFRSSIAIMLAFFFIDQSSLLFMLICFPSHMFSFPYSR